jgi:hypothetical protein
MPRDQGRYHGHAAGSGWSVGSLDSSGDVAQTVISLVYHCARTAGGPDRLAFKG